MGDLETLALIGLGLFVFASRKPQQGSGAVQPSGWTPNPSGPSRCLRNNNPGCIKAFGDVWKGEVPRSQNGDGTFAQFYELEKGMRAQMKLLYNYYTKEGKRTIRQIINRWAPNTENPTHSYIQRVHECSSINPDTNIVLPLYQELVPLIAFCMADVENGGQFITLAKYKNVLNLYRNEIF